MAQPNVAREPSMEEILASIRRIIENNETPEGVELQPAPATEEADDAIHLTVEGKLPSYEQDHMPTHSDAANEDAPAPVEMHEMSAVSSSLERSKPMSLADVAARVRASAERGPMPIPASEAEATVAEDEFVAHVDDEIVETSENQPAPEQPMAEMPNVVEEPKAAVPEAAPRQEIAVSAPADTGSIVSAATGERVTKSFEELAQALNASPRSLEEIAGEMLRPMLQEWLDDNLPSLVERLVRDEIERVARGPRR